VIHITPIEDKDKVLCIPGVWYRYARLTTPQNELCLEANVSKLLVLLFFF
jgi:hypothetical protein